MPEEARPGVWHVSWAGDDPPKVLDESNHLIATVAGEPESRALARAGLRPVVAIDLEPQARLATLRDRPGLYDLVLTGDVAALNPSDVAAIQALQPNALTLVGALGNDHVSPAGVRAAAALLSPDALMAYAHPEYEDDAPLRAALAELGDVTELDRRRYVHRRTASGGERTWQAAVLRLSRTVR